MSNRRRNWWNEPAMYNLDRHGRAHRIAPAGFHDEPPQPDIHGNLPRLFTNVDYSILERLMLERR